MAKRKLGTFAFDAPPEGKNHLLVRNITDQILAIPNNTPSATDDLFLHPWQEAVLDADIWKNNRNLRTNFQKGSVSLQWVEQTYVARTVPAVDNAPPEILPDQAFDREHVRQIVILVDENKSLELINQSVDSPSTNETDVSFMKSRMHRILRTVEWMEPQVQNRTAILRAAKERLSWIRAL